MTEPISPQIIEEAMRLAIREAEKYAGSTTPNPPVGATGIDPDGNILAVAAHHRAGEPHAERNLIQIFKDLDELEELHTMVVTLEPCNHQGRTGPCTEAIIEAGVKRIIVGVRDPNPDVAGGGIDRLREAGIQVAEGVLAGDCSYLARSFFHKARTGRPWITVKQAIRDGGSMIPPEGKKTFTSPEGLTLAHRLRRRADAILTGSGTVLADNPLFTVRHVPDFPHKQRYLVALDRRGRISTEWKESVKKSGFQLLEASSIEEALLELGRRDVMEVLVEAGPELSNHMIREGLWDERVVIRAGVGADTTFKLRDPESVIGRESRKGSYCLPGLFKPCAPFVG